MPQTRVLLGFANATDHQIEELAGVLISHLYTAPGFPATPPVPSAALQTYLSAFTTAIVNQQQGGTVATAAKKEARAALVGVMRQLAAWVQLNGGNDPAKMMATGFEVVTGSKRAQYPLDTPAIKALEIAGTTRLHAAIDPIRGADNYSARWGLAATPMVYSHEAIFQNTKNIEPSGLIPGQNYTVQVCANGGSTGRSEWSNAVTAMSV